MWVVIAIYVVGTIAGVLFTDAKPLMRIGFALAWPIGPLAFAVVVTGLVLASLYIFPIFGAVAAAGLAAGWWFLA